MIYTIEAKQDNNFNKNVLLPTNECLELRTSWFGINSYVPPKNWTVCNIIQAILKIAKLRKNYSKALSLKIKIRKFQFDQGVPVPMIVNSAVKCQNFWKFQMLIALS